MVHLYLVLAGLKYVRLTAAHTVYAIMWVVLQQETRRIDFKSVRPAYIAHSIVQDLSTCI